MARRVVILCDPCSAKDINAEGEEEIISINNLKPRLVAMCESCRKEFLEPLEQLIKEHGTIATGDLVKPTKQAAMLPGMPTVRVSCPVDGCGAELKNEDSLVSHARSAHGLVKSQVMAMLAGHEPDDVPRPDKKPNVVKAACDYVDPKTKEKCDVVYEWPKDPRPTTALGVHKKMKHGISGAKKSK